MTQKETSPLLHPADSRKGGDPMDEGYTSYGYLGTVDGRLIEIVSPEELYELLEDDA